MNNTANLVKKLIGIDIGGMTIKGIIIRGDETVLCEDSIETVANTAEIIFAKIS